MALQAWPLGLPGHHDTCISCPANPARPRSLLVNPVRSPEVDLGQCLQQLRPHQPVGAVPQAQQVCDQPQPQLTVAAAAEAHDAVLGMESEAEAMAMAMVPGQRAAAAPGGL